MKTMRKKVKKILTLKRCKSSTVILLMGVLILKTNSVYAESKKLASKKAEAATEEVPLSVEKTKDVSAGGENSGEVDISDVQNQYWKAHDKQFEVIQNKQYTKAGRVEITPLFGLYQRISFQDTKTVGGAISYHFNEMFGAEVSAYTMINNDSATLKRFKETRGATIEFNEEKSFYGFSPVFTPIYAKFSFLGKKISHFDMYISPILGATKTNDYRFTYGIGVGQKFWLSPRWNIRIEYRWTQYNDRTTTNEGSTAAKNGGPGYYDDTVNNQNLLFGVGFLF